MDIFCYVWLIYLFNQFYSIIYTIGIDHPLAVHDYVFYALSIVELVQMEWKLPLCTEKSIDFSLAWCKSNAQLQLTHNKTMHKKIWSICLLRLCFNHISNLPAYLLCNSVLNLVNKVYITCIYAMVRISYHTVSNRSGKYKIGDCMRLDFHCCACTKFEQKWLANCHIMARWCQPKPLSWRAWHDEGFGWHHLTMTCQFQVKLMFYPRSVCTNSLNYK